MTYLWRFKKMEMNLGKRSLSQNMCTVAECYINSGWQLHFRRNFNDWEMDDISHLSHLLDPITLEGTRHQMHQGKSERGSTRRKRKEEGDQTCENAGLN
ncbi:hypothetical protein H5410_012544 [Solanum commersonii]|uniref:Uncharacterized protein n=1 Tax=Solanum commersonii TaxID=4109 RepID=A0A9J6AS04_SOLCO|nr:hypothetical protein H5410_012544 [Solanum commersonii]